MIHNIRYRYIIFSVISLFFLIATTLHIRGYPLTSLPIHEDIPISDPAPNVVPPPEPPKKASYPKYKKESTSKASPIVDNFPLALAAHSAKDLPPIPAWNHPPKKHVDLQTPLFIGFTRNWRLLQQVVVSYITAGWPPEDIYVVENTGVMDSNEKGKLSLQNPFFVNYTRLHMFGVNIIRTPTLFSFAQLQNFYIHTALEKKWATYFWSHMDVVTLSFEDRILGLHPEIADKPAESPPYESLYMNAVGYLREALNGTDDAARWALRFFHYDHLALVNVEAFMEIGAWDTMIPFYMTDCDMHARLSMAKFDIKEVEAGIIFDVAASLDDLVVLYRKADTNITASFTDPNTLGKRMISAGEEEAIAGEVETRFVETLQQRSWFDSYWKDDKKWQDDKIGNEEGFLHLVHTLDAMVHSKSESKAGRNTWQGRQVGGKGEPFYRDSAGFEKAIQMTIEHGRAVFSEKWGHRDCDIREKGLVADDAWRVEHDWW